MNARQAAVLGAIVADAASLGLHWLYDPARLALIAQRGPVAFLDPDPRNYEGVRGYFAHGGKHAGDLSGYGEAAALMLRHLAENGGRLDRLGYQQAWVKHFGPGGPFVGYVDKPTRATLQKLLAIEKPEDWPARSGIDDDQLPALECVPALVAAHRGDGASLEAAIETAVGITSDNPLAVDGALVLSRGLRALIEGAPLRTALARAASSSGAVLRPLLDEALGMSPSDAVAAAQRFGPACHMHQGLPVAFHILANAKSYTGAVEASIVAAGDSCGRSLAVGSMAGAAFAAENGIPTSWLARVGGMARHAAAAELLTE
jgi:ADP-ribosylglycohydrolase